MTHTLYVDVTAQGGDMAAVFPGNVAPWWLLPLLWMFNELPSLILEGTLGFDGGLHALFPGHVLPSKAGHSSGIVSTKAACNLPVK